MANPDVTSVYTGNNDLEAPMPKTPENRTIALMEAGGLLLLWSVLVINEGAIRLIGTNPSDDILAGGRPPRFILFLGGVVEMFFGLLGVYVGAAAFLKKWHNENVTKIAMLVQSILGYYVFAVFVFVAPSFQATDLSAPRLPGLTLGQDKFVIALGVLTSFHFCLALQGGQFVFMARLVSAATGRDFLMQKSGSRMRAVFWNANMAMSGLWTIITGSLIVANVGGGKIEKAFVSPPNVGRLPGFTISTGVTLLLWGIVGIALAFARWELPYWYYTGSAYVYVIALLNFGVAQFSLLGDPSAGGPVALHNGLVFMVVFIATYFSHQASEELKAPTA